MRRPRDAVVEADACSRRRRAAATSSRARRAASSRSSSAPRRRRSSCAGRGGRRCRTATADRPARGRSSASGRSCRRRPPGCARCRRRRCRPRAGPCRQATAAAVPPDEPPAVFAGFQGLRVMPVSGELVSPLQPNSGVVVLPRITAPASRRRAVTGASTSQGCAGSTVREPRSVGHAGDQDQVLDRHRHAVERAARRAARCQRASLARADASALVGGDADEGVEDRVEALDPRQHRARRLDRRRRARAVEAQQLGGACSRRDRRR